MGSLFGPPFKPGKLSLKIETEKNENLSKVMARPV